MCTRPTEPRDWGEASKLETEAFVNWSDRKTDGDLCPAFSYTVMINLFFFGNFWHVI